MKTNKKKPTRRRSFSLKARSGGDFSPSNRRIIKVVLLPLLLITVCAGVFFCGYKTYKKLLDIRNDQWQVTDINTQVIIKPSQHFTEELIRDSFGLKEGCNLASINFAEKRVQTLAKRPLLSDITITKNLARKTITIAVEERKPIARINYTKDKNNYTSWLVVDSKGVVFAYSNRDSYMLPVIKESHPSAKEGDKISGRPLMGLKLIELAASKEISNIDLAEVDVSSDIYLTATTRDYNKIELLWIYLNEHGEHDTANMRDALRNINSIINTGLETEPYKTFIVTGKNRVTVSSKEHKR